MKAAGARFGYDGIAANEICQVNWPSDRRSRVLRFTEAHRGDRRPEREGRHAVVCRHGSRQCWNCARLVLELLRRHSGTIKKVLWPFTPSTPKTD